MNRSTLMVDRRQRSAKALAVRAPRIQSSACVPWLCALLLLCPATALAHICNNLQSTMPRSTEPMTYPQSASAGQDNVDVGTLHWCPRDPTLPPEPGPEPPLPPAPPPAPSNLIIGAECSLPGPINDSECTVLYHVRYNPANNIICLWNEDALVACEGRTFWGGGFPRVTAAGTTLEFRHHDVWPTEDPAWPNRSIVRSKGDLLKSQEVRARYRISPSDPCSMRVSPGTSIGVAVSTGLATICLDSGLHVTGGPISPVANQTVRSTFATQPATIRPPAGVPAFDVRTSNVTIKNLVIDSPTSARARNGVSVTGATNLLIDDVTINYALYPVTINSSLNVELRNSTIYHGGDGVAGGAHPSIWVNDSYDVRVIQSSIINNGVGPEGDGELACYNSTGLVVYNSTVSNSGAAGMYLVNCDRAVVIGNRVESAGEWGIDIVDTGQPSGTDFGLFQWNEIEGSRHGGVVMVDSVYNTFSNNHYIHNRQGPDASGSCNGVNRRGNTTGFFQFNDVGTPWPVRCSD